MSWVWRTYAVTKPRIPKAHELRDFRQQGQRNRHGYYPKSKSGSKRAGKGEQEHERTK